MLPIMADHTQRQTLRIIDFERRTLTVNVLMCRHDIDAGAGGKIAFDAGLPTDPGAILLGAERRVFGIRIHMIIHVIMLYAGPEIFQRKIA